MAEKRENLTREPVKRVLRHIFDPMDPEKSKNPVCFILRGDLDDVTHKLNQGALALQQMRSDNRIFDSQIYRRTTVLHESNGGLYRNCVIVCNRHFQNENVDIKIPPWEEIPQPKPGLSGFVFDDVYYVIVWDVFGAGSPDENKLIMFWIGQSLEWDSGFRIQNEELEKVNTRRIISTYRIPDSDGSMFETEKTEELENIGVLTVWGNQNSVVTRDTSEPISLGHTYQPPSYRQLSRDSLQWVDFLDRDGWWGGLENSIGHLHFTPNWETITPEPIIIIDSGYKREFAATTESWVEIQETGRRIGDTHIHETSSYHWAIINDGSGGESSSGGSGVYASGVATEDEEHWVYFKTTNYYYGSGESEKVYSLVIDDLEMDWIINEDITILPVHMGIYETGQNDKGKVLLYIATFKFTKKEGDTTLIAYEYHSYRKNVQRRLLTEWFLEDETGVDGHEIPGREDYYPSEYAKGKVRAAIVKSGKQIVRDVETV